VGIRSITVRMTLIIQSLTAPSECLPDTRPINTVHVLSLLGTPLSCHSRSLSTSHDDQLCESFIAQSNRSLFTLSFSPRSAFKPLSYHRCLSVLFISGYLVYNPSTEQAFGSGPNCLGIIIVRDLPPEYSKLRERLLKLAHAFSQLDESVREKYADAKSRYRFEISPTVIIV
jgi:hypothetical protein